MHKGCWHGHRCYRRIARADPKKLELFDNAFVSDQPYYKKCVEPLTAAPGVKRDRRTVTQLGVVIKTKKIKETFSSKRTNRRTLKLTKRRYKGWAKTWEGFDSDEASQEFDQILENQDTDHADSDDEPRILVKGNEALENLSGTRDSDRKEKVWKPKADVPMDAQAASKAGGPYSPGHPMQLALTLNT